MVGPLLGLKGWYTGLQVRRVQVSAERLTLTSYAVFRTRSSDSSSSLLGFSIWLRPRDTVRQPAEQTVAASGRLPASGHVLSVVPRGAEPGKYTTVSEAMLRPPSGFWLGMFF